MSGNSVHLTEVGIACMKHVTSLLTTLLAEQAAQPSRAAANVTARTVDHPVHGETVGGLILIR